MKSEKEISDQRDLLIEYSMDQTGYRLTPRLFTDKQIQAQIMVFNWVLDEKDFESVKKRIRLKVMEENKARLMEELNIV